MGHAVSSGPSKRTMKSCGQIGKTEVLIVVACGNVGTFVSDHLAHKLQVFAVPCALSQFVGVDGSQMVCTHKALNLQWHSQAHTFTLLWVSFHWGQTPYPYPLRIYSFMNSSLYVLQFNTDEFSIKK